VIAALASLLVAVLAAGPAFPSLYSAGSPVPDAAQFPSFGYELPDVPDIAAPSWLVYDVDTGITLAAHNPDLRLPMASTTKLMTALLAIERGDLADIVTVSYDAAIYRAPSGFGLATGEEWTLDELLTALMVRSANDAAMAIGEHLGGTVEEFVAMMNARAIELGLEDTSFANPSGLDAPGHYSTANDLLALAQVALRQPLIARLAQTKVVKFRDDPWGNDRWGTNTNALLGAYPGILGVKTGSTPNAKMVLVALAERGERRIITVVLGSDDSFADTRSLLEYGFATYGPADRLFAPLLDVAGGDAAARIPDDLRDRASGLAPLLVRPEPPLPGPEEVPVVAVRVLDLLQDWWPGLFGAG
jgi:D-alanyl-D-alanine carboxypeptidase